MPKKAKRRNEEADDIATIKKAVKHAFDRLDAGEPIESFAKPSEKELAFLTDEPDAALVTEPRKWIAITDKLPPELRRKIDRHFETPVMIMHITVISLPLRDFTRDERALIRDAYAAVVPHVTKIDMGD